MICGNSLATPTGRPWHRRGRNHGQDSRAVTARTLPQTASRQILSATVPESSHHAAGICHPMRRCREVARATEADMIIATYAEDSSHLADARRMIASLRRFGGPLHDLSVWIVTPNESVYRLAERDFADSVTGPVRSLEIQIPEAIAWLPLAGKAVAAAAAESLAERETDVLVWVDPTRSFSIRRARSCSYRIVRWPGTRSCTTAANASTMRRSTSTGVGYTNCCD